MFRLSFHNSTKSPPTTSPVTVRSIDGGFFIAIDIHLLHCFFQWSVIPFLRLFILGHISNGDSRSLEAFPRGDDDEGDRGTWVCEESAFPLEVAQIILLRRLIVVVRGGKDNVTNLYPLRHLGSRFPTYGSNVYI